MTNAELIAKARQEPVLLDSYTMEWVDLARALAEALERTERLLAQVEAADMVYDRAIEVLHRAEGLGAEGAETYVVTHNHGLPPALAAYRRVKEG